MREARRHVGRVVVTGAAGFLGRHVVAALLDDGHRVLGLDRRPWAPHPGEAAVRTDLLDAEAAPVLGHATAVVHLAGCPGVRDDRPDAGRWRWRDNVLATQAVLDATPRDVPLVVTSSSSVYGGAGSPTAPRACRETDTRRPRGGYARSKAAVEDLCAAASWAVAPSACCARSPSPARGNAPTWPWHGGSRPCVPAAPCTCSGPWTAGGT